MNPKGRAVFVHLPPHLLTRVRRLDAFVKLDEFKNPRQELRLQNFHPTERVFHVDNGNSSRSHDIVAKANAASRSRQCVVSTLQKSAAVRAPVESRKILANDGFFE